jgi:type I restriction-modification system DNA methylase subunit
MKQEVRTMLEDMYGLFYEKYKDPIKSWDSMIEFIAIDNSASLIWQLNDKFKWLYENSNLVEKIMKIYDYKLLQSDFHDHLGDMYIEKIISNNRPLRKGLDLNQTNISDFLTRVSVREKDDPTTILDPEVGTGRLLMAVYKKVPNSIVFGADSDLRALRIAYANFAIHDIDGYLLHADHLKHELDRNTKNGKYNWRYANSWHSHFHKLRPLSKFEYPAPQYKQGEKKIP